jgi:hypothetical protein
MKDLNVREEDHRRFKQRCEQEGVSMAEMFSQMIKLEFVPVKPPKIEKPPKPVKELTPRQMAVAQGKDTYDGKPCELGHGTLRYTRSYQCVTCSLMQGLFKLVPGEGVETMKLREQALYHPDGYKYYESPVHCSACGTTTRWIKSGQCSHCYSGDGARIR